MPDCVVANALTVAAAMLTVAAAAAASTLHSLPASDCTRCAADCGGVGTTPLLLGTDGNPQPPVRCPATALPGGTSTPRERGGSYVDSSCASMW